MGAIAASGKPEALQLFREVMLASASVPIVFPPVQIHVDAGGKKFDEIHVDGGTVSQVFLLPTRESFSITATPREKRGLLGNRACRTFQIKRRL
jgi:predicted acylesterase/phospholipase RssA